MNANTMPTSGRSVNKTLLDKAKNLHLSVDAKDILSICVGIFLIENEGSDAALIVMDRVHDRMDILAPLIAKSTNEDDQIEAIFFAFDQGQEEAIN